MVKKKRQIYASLVLEVSDLVSADTKKKRKKNYSVGITTNKEKIRVKSFAVGVLRLVSITVTNYLRLIRTESMPFNLKVRFK